MWLRPWNPIGRNDGTVSQPISIIWLAALLVFSYGCGPVLIPFDSNVPAQVLSYIGAPPVTDATHTVQGNLL
jgi:hypothetical protein